MNISSKIYLILIVFGLTAIVCFFILKTSNDKERTQAEIGQKQIIEIYTQKVSDQTDAYELTLRGLAQLDAQLPEMALISLRQATIIKPDYRDAWLSLGLAQLETKNYENALISLKEAQKIDPIHAKTYELLRIVYENIGQFDAAKAAQEKYKFLVGSE